MRWWTLRQLNSKNDETRRRAVVELAASTDASVLDKLIDIVGRGSMRAVEVRTRIAAIQALGKIGGDRAARVLVNAVVRPGDDPGIRVAAQEALLQVGSVALESLAAAVRWANVERDPAVATLKRFRETAWRPMLSSIGTAARHGYNRGGYGPFPADRIVETLTEVAGRNTLRRLIEALGDPDPNIRIAAATLLAGLHDSAAIGPLAIAVQDTDKHVHNAALKSLASFGAQAVEELSAIVAGLNEPSRVLVIQTLGNSGDQRAVARLLSIVPGGWPEREATAAALSSLGWQPAHDEERAGHYIGLRKWDEAASLGSVAVAPLALVAAGPAGEGAYWGMQRDAVQALGNTRSSQAVPTLTALLKDARRDQALTATVVEALAKIEDPATAEPLATMISHRDQRIRSNAAAALQRLGAASVPVLIVALEDEDKWTRTAAAELLGAIQDPRALRPLIARLEKIGSDYYAREQRDSLAAALTQFGPIAVGPLLDTLVDDNVSEVVVEVLGRIGDRKAVPQLVGLLTHQEQRVQLAAIYALGRLKDTRPLTPLASLLDRQDAVVRSAAATAIAGIEGALSDRLLRKLLSDPNSTVRKIAADALNSRRWVLSTEDERIWFAVASGDWNAVAALGAASVEALAVAVRDDDWQFRRAAEETLARIGRPAVAPLVAMHAWAELAHLKREAVPALVHELEHGDSASRAGAAEALKLIGKNARNAFPTLVTALSDSSRTVRRHAAEAIARIGSRSTEAAPHLVKMWIEHGELDSSGFAIIEKLGIRDERLIDPLLRGLFAALGSGQWGGVKDYLQLLTQTSSLTKEIVGWIVEASGYEHRYRGWRYDAGYITFEHSDTAIRSLCAIKSTVTSNVLHLVAQKQDVSVTMSTGCTNPWQETVSFANQRKTALEELKLRGNPPYDPLAYLRSSDAKRVARQAQAEARRAREVRYQQLLALVQSPRRDRGETKWTYLDELARDFNRLEVFKMLVNDLSRHLYISLDDLGKYESLLALAGRHLNAFTLRIALAPLRRHLPQSYSTVIRRIKQSRAGDDGR